jgi:hypothetical protein
MAYMSQERKKELLPAIKAVLKKYWQKATVGVRHYSTLVINIKAWLIPAGSYINEYHIASSEWFDEKQRRFLMDLKCAAMFGNHDRSDVMTDYFDVGWYLSMRVV